VCMHVRARVCKQKSTVHDVIIYKQLRKATCRSRLTYFGRPGELLYVFIRFPVETRVVSVGGACAVRVV